MFLSLPALIALFLFTGCMHAMNAEPRTLSIQVTVPDPAWKVSIDEVYVAEGKLLVVSSLSRDPRLMAAQVISRATDKLTIEAPDLPVEHYVLGKTFRWSQDSHHFVESRKELEKQLKDARRIYPSKKLLKE